MIGVPHHPTSVQTMAVDLIGRAKEKQAEIERQRQEIRARLQQLDKEAEKWRTFVEDAESLATGKKPKAAKQIPSTNGSPPKGSSASRPILIEGSLPADAAQLIRDKGPHTLDNLLAALQDKQGNRSAKSFRTSVYSALWRRLDDVFCQTEDGGFDLQTTDFVIMPPQKAKK